MQIVTQGTVGSMTQQLNSIVQNSEPEDQSSVTLEAVTSIFNNIESASLELDDEVRYT